jgi:hypothetical protein
MAAGILLVVIGLGLGAVLNVFIQPIGNPYSLQAQQFNQLVVFAFIIAGAICLAGGVLTMVFDG